MGTAELHDRIRHTLELTASHATNILHAVLRCKIGAEDTRANYSVITDGVSRFIDGCRAGIRAGDVFGIDWKRVWR